MNLWLRVAQFLMGCHGRVSHERRHNYVEEMFVGGKGVRGNEAMREAARAFYFDLYSENGSLRPKLDNLQFPCLRDSDRAELEGVFLEEEVRSCLFDCNGDNAPDPDGLNMRFLQDFWLVFKDDIMELFDEFHKNGSFLNL